MGLVSNFLFSQLQISSYCYHFSLFSDKKLGMSGAKIEEYVEDSAMLFCHCKSSERACFLEWQSEKG